ncbi:hypothetical protein [Sinosporangium siamense]|uniref:Uncharacterized protein n=1 Tax=Sinosporangium siamense TaxID=1367973 RepID=A0A919RNJ8_9ACTN|nr:hypothetical protein [Sinosporangium siamense]GII97056.1 hypothetical protein Ssi02_72870 [Sinosporangium siamense]
MANLRPFWDYRAAPQAGRITLLRASEEYDPSGPWRDLALGELEVRGVGGNHYTMMRPFQVGEVAAVLGEVFGQDAEDDEDPHA